MRFSRVIITRVIRIMHDLLQDPQAQYIREVHVCMDRDSYKPIPCPAKTQLKVAQKAALERTDRDKCKGLPQLCLCLDTLVYAEFHKRRQEPKLRVIH